MMKAAQNVVGFVGVVLGLIPLLQYVFFGGNGLWSFVVGDDPALPWIHPLAVLVAAVVGVVVLDRMERAHR
ncbi:hypothetical protein [Pseudonocardia sp. HH130630-07]|uniref:hypothetical protein n=1 Tax=Pseudonocardia sp. HH130630-07 TaxID=1690815 RepID=UPI000815275A|nr:hypothetical protein [Pseudonocardia sp. HH130630-07]ANY06061.1 hypothetical protein AFB00_06795 [Pseudonocardia sp. HH130630-07]